MKRASAQIRPVHRAGLPLAGAHAGVRAVQGMGGGRVQDPAPRAGFPKAAVLARLFVGADVADGN